MDNFPVGGCPFFLYIFCSILQLVLSPLIFDRSSKDSNVLILSIKGILLARHEQERVIYLLTLNGLEHEELLEVTTENTATQADLEKFKKGLQTKVLQEEPVNILFVFKNIEGITAKGLLEDVKTFPYLKSIGKAAVVADDTFTKIDAKIADLFPGIEVGQYQLDELDNAREWVQS